MPAAAPRPCASCSTNTNGTACLLVLSGLQACTDEVGDPWRQGGSEQVPSVRLHPIPGPCFSLFSFHLLWLLAFVFAHIVPSPRCPSYSTPHYCIYKPDKKVNFPKLQLLVCFFSKLPCPSFLITPPSSSFQVNIQLSSSFNKCSRIYG